MRSLGFHADMETSQRDARFTPNSGQTRARRIVRFVPKADIALTVSVRQKLVF